ncbi:MAG: cation diffusion facilitator family transporter [Desulfobacterales bacterium]|nr:cation diffusion facilitator family transporter [Desulfobacterales bacterium]
MASASSKKVIYAALAGNFLIALTKFIAFFVTKSSAMLSEGVHSVVDTSNQVLLLYGLRQAKKPADARFPFGHGKEVYFWCFLVAIMIFAVGAAVSIYKGVHHLLHPTPIQNPIINYVVLAFALLFEGAAWYLAFTEFKKAKGKWGYLEAVQHGKDPTIFVVLFEDSAAMLGILAAFVGIFLSQLTNNSVYDGIASIIIGLILAGTAAWLAYETKGLLIGESANPRIVKGIRNIASAYSKIKHVNEVLTLHMGPDFILLNLSVDFADSLSAGDIEDTIARLDRQIKQAYPKIKRIFVEAESRGVKTDSV